MGKKITFDNRLFFEEQNLSIFNRCWTCTICRMKFLNHFPWKTQECSFPNDNVFHSKAANIPNVKKKTIETNKFKKPQSYALKPLNYRQFIEEYNENI